MALVIRQYSALKWRRKAYRRRMCYLRYSTFDDQGNRALRWKSFASCIWRLCRHGIAIMPAGGLQRWRQPAGMAANQRSASLLLVGSAWLCGWRGPLGWYAQPLAWQRRNARRLAAAGAGWPETVRDIGTALSIEQAICGCELSCLTHSLLFLRTASPALLSIPAATCRHCRTCLSGGCRRQKRHHGGAQQQQAGRSVMA